MTINHPGSSGHRLDQFSGLAPHRVHPGAPVSEQLPGLLGILPLIDALKHQPHLVGRARHTPFQGHRLPLLGFLLSPVHPVLEPHPPITLQPVPLPNIGPAFVFPNLVAPLHHILDDVELVVHHPSVPAVVAHSLGVGGAHFDGHIVNRLRVAVVPQQFRKRSQPNRRVPTGRNRKAPLGHKIREYFNYLLLRAGSFRWLPPTPRSQNSTAHTPPSHGRRASSTSACRSRRGSGRHASRASPASESRRVGPELLDEVLAAPLPGRSHTVHFAVVASAPPRQGTHDYELLVENVEVPPLHRLDMVVAGHRGPGARAFLRPQRGRLFDLQHEGRRTCLKPRLNHTPGFAKPQQLSKRLLGCHRLASSCGRQAPPVPTGNSEE